MPKTVLKYLLILIALLLCVFSYQVGAEGRLRKLLQHELPAQNSLLNHAAVEHELTVNGIERHYQVHIPRSNPTNKPLPLIIALHGGGGDMKHMARDERYGLISKAEQAGFALLFPNGTGALRGDKLATWNAGACCGNARDNNVDDVAFIRAAIQQVSDVYTIDSQRIFAIGMSNGGMMAYRLACDAADLFKGIMSVAGTDNTKQCHPSRPVAVLHIHALDDDHVLFNGGAGANAFRDHEKVTEFVSVADTITKWIEINHSTALPRRILTTPDAYCDLYSSQSASAAPVQLCVTTGGGHSWPGGQKWRGQPTSQAIIANDLMWTFFSAL